MSPKLSKEDPVKLLLINLVSMLLLSSLVISDTKGELTLYRWETSSRLVLDGLVDQQTQPKREDEKQASRFIRYSKSKLIDFVSPRKVIYSHLYVPSI